MPNHVTNIVTFKGERERVEALLASVRGAREGADGLDLFDFEKITPMPPELHVTSDGLVAYLENRFYKNRSMDSLLSDLLRSSEEGIDNFCQALKNLKKHGHASWYEWSIANWGTKWNSYDLEQRDWNVIKFETAWSYPEPVFTRLSQIFPDVVIEVEYADEDIGANCAYVSFKGGVRRIIQEFASGSPEAKAFGYLVTGRDPKADEEEEVVDGNAG